MPLMGLACQVYSRIYRLARSRGVVFANCLQPAARFYSNAVAVANATAENLPAPHRLAVESELRSSAGGKSLDHIIEQVEYQIRHDRRVNLHTLHTALRIARQNQHADLGNTTVAQLLRFTGGVLRQMAPQEREELTSLVWALADQQNLDISHYNALLQAYLENGTKFDPLAFLETLDAAGVAPNRVTYQRLIQRYCNLGDVGGAAMIREFMKSEQLPETERVLNAFVRGHVLAGDEASARKVIEFMAQAEDLSLTAETYTVLAEALIEKGCTNKALEAIQGHSLSDEQVLRIAKALALQNDTASIRAVTEIMPLSLGFTRDITNSCLEILSHRKLEAARILFEKIPVDESQKVNSDCVIGQMVRSHLPLVDVARFCQELKDSGVNESGLLTAAEVALHHSDHSTAVDYIRRLQQAGYRLRPHFFYPIVCKAQTETEVYDTVRSMLWLGLFPTEEMLINYVLPRLNLERPAEVLNQFLESGCSYSKCLYALVKYFLLGQEVEKCVALLAEHRCELDARVAALAGEAATADNIDQCVKVLKEIVNQPPVKVSDLLDPVCEFLSALPEDLLSAAIAAIEKEHLRINRTLYKHLLDSALEDEVWPATWTLKKATMTLGELESQLAKLESKNMRTRGVLSKLLLGYCRTRAVPKADATLRKLQGYKLFGSELDALIDLSIYRNDLEASLEFYRQGLKRSDFFIEDFRVVKLAAFVIQNGTIAVAKSILNRHIFNEVSLKMQGNAKHLVKTALERCGVEETLTIVHDYVTKFTPITSSVFSPIMKHVLDNRDTATSYALFMDIVNRYRVTPHQSEVLLKLINGNEDKMLDDLVAAVAKLQSGHKINFTLASCYISLGQVDKARALLRALPLERMQTNIEYTCEILTTKKLIRELEAHIALFDELGHDKDTLSYMLMRGYLRVGNYDAALDLWTQAQENDVLLSGRTLLYLGRTLERYGVKVPFVIPEGSLAPTPRGVIEKKMLSPFSAALQNSIDDALRFRDMVMSKGAPLTMQEETKLICALANDDQLHQAFTIFKQVLQHRAPGEPYVSPRMGRFVLTRLAQHGMVDEIASIRPLLDEELRVTYNIDLLLSSAYALAGRASEYLDILDEATVTGTVCANWLNEVLEKDPNNSERLLRIARRFVHSGENYSIVNAIWMRLFTKGEFSKADAILEEFPKMLKQNLLLVQVLDQIRETCDEATSERLLAIVKRVGSKQLYAMALDTHISMLRRRQRGG